MSNTCNISQKERAGKLPELYQIFSEYEIRGINSWDEIECLGTNDINILLVRLRKNEKNFTLDIHELKEHVKMFEGKDGSYFIELAKEFSNPEIKYKGVYKGHVLNKNIEPIGIECEQRERGSTNFNICGWCKYAGGLHRFNYCISGKCNLLSETRYGAIDANKVLRTGVVINYRHEVVFDTPCLLFRFTEEQLQGGIIGAQYNLGIFTAKRERVRKGICKLVSLRILKRKRIREGIHRLVLPRDTSKSNK